MDDTFQIYVNRVMGMTVPETFSSKLQNIQSSPKFRLGESGTAPLAVPFPGLTIITPSPHEDSQNAEFYSRLQAYQQSLVEALGSSLLAPVPPESFHITLADLIWDGAYRHATEQPEFEEKLRDRIGEIFQEYQPRVQSGHPLRWQVAGLLIMARAIGVSLVPKDEYSYEQITQLRRAIYQNSGLIALGIEQQYHLTAHVTLGYFCDLPSDLEREETNPRLMQLTQTLTQLNDQLIETSLEFTVTRAEFRKFDDMNAYYRQPTWPVLEF
ncbi:MAG: DUF1868 domain-containing protein [Leptolyngbyaceae cyanobacterium bins.59]|nr:DUF1868 domain-containing protein [Leptolyngbyaceae cyanobacterium bins.59]